MYFIRVNKRLAVIFQTGICASIYAYPSKYGMTQGNFLSNKQFLIVYHILDLFTLGGETVLSASFMAHILVFRCSMELFTVWGSSVCFIGSYPPDGLFK